MNRKKFVILLCVIAAVAGLTALFLRPISLIRHKDFKVLTVSCSDGENERLITDDLDLEQVEQILAGTKCRRRIEPMLWPSFRAEQLRYDISIFYPTTGDHVTIYLGLPDEIGEDTIMNKAYRNNSGLFNFCWRILEPDTLIAALDSLH